MLQQGLQTGGGGGGGGGGAWGGGRYGLSNNTTKPLPVSGVGGEGRGDHHDSCEVYMIPTGTSNETGVSGTKFYCPRCESLYDPDVLSPLSGGGGEKGVCGSRRGRDSEGGEQSEGFIAGDGAAWGTSFAGMFCLANPMVGQGRVGRQTTAAMTTLEECRGGELEQGKGGWRQRDS